VLIKSVKILTAGVSLADILMRESVHPESLFKRTPFSLGWDIVGIVDISNIVSLYITNHCVASKNLLL
jgi:hypothetical protein